MHKSNGPAKYLIVSDCVFPAVTAISIAACREHGADHDEFLVAWGIAPSP
jgi:hypothetical protein